MEDDGFHMPALNGQITETRQIKVLSSVRSSAVSSYESLYDEKSRLRHLFPNSISIRDLMFATGENAQIFTHLFDHKQNGYHLTTTDIQVTKVSYHRKVNCYIRDDP